MAGFLDDYGNWVDDTSTPSYDPNLDSNPAYNGSVQYPTTPGGTQTQTYDDGSTLTTDSSGNVVGYTNAQTGQTISVPPGGKVDSSGNILDSLGKIVGSIPPELRGMIAGALNPTLSNLFSGGYLKSTADMLMNAGQNIRNVQAPNLSALIPQLQLQVQQGTMTAQQASAAAAQAAQQANSLMSGVNTDQQSLAAQRAALARLADVGTSGGMTEADRAQLAATINQTNAAAAQQRAAQLQQLQMQGNAGTGAELATRLAGGQQTANANAMAGANVAQGAQARALAAIQANLQGNAALNTQQFQQAAQKAQAQDVVNQFNTQAQNTIAAQNAQMATQAAIANAQLGTQANQANFAMANQINAANTAIKNQNLLMPLQTAQQQFQNVLGQQAAASTADVGAGKDMAALVNAQLQRSNTAAGGATTQAAAAPAPAPSSGGGGGSSWLKDLGSAAGAVGSLIGIFSDEDLKTDKKELSDDEVDNMMASMTGYKYRYKGPNTNPMTAGVMAQDMPKDSVVDTPAGKMVQKPEALSHALAILANQHNRIKRLEGKQ